MKFSLSRLIATINDNLMFLKLRYVPRTDMLNSILYKANQLWNLLPENLKSSPSLTLLKKEIKLLEWFNSPCNIFKSFVPNIAYCILGKHFPPAFSPILDTGFESCLGRTLITESMLLYVSISCKGTVLSKLY